MQFLKTTEQIASKLITYPNAWRDAFLFTNHLVTNHKKRYFDKLDYIALSSVKDNFKYSCGSGKRFEFRDATRIGTFFRVPNFPSLHGGKTHKVGRMEQEIQYGGYARYGGWYCYVFIKNPNGSAGDYCNLVEIYYESSRFDLHGDLFLEYIFQLPSSKTHIKTLWFCKYKTVCELFIGKPGIDFNERAFMKKGMKNLHKEYAPSAQEEFIDDIIDDLRDGTKNLLNAIKNKDWYIVRNIIFMFSFMSLLYGIMILFLSWFTIFLLRLI